MLAGGDSSIDVSATAVDMASSLSELTRPMQNMSILPLDIKNTNNILSSLLKSVYG